MEVIRGICSECNDEHKLIRIRLDPSDKFYCHNCTYKLFAQFINEKEKLFLAQLLISSEVQNEHLKKKEKLIKKYPDLSRVIRQNDEIVKKFFLKLKKELMIN